MSSAFYLGKIYLRNVFLKIILCFTGCEIEHWYVKMTVLKNKQQLHLYKLSRFRLIKGFQCEKQISLQIYITSKL